MIEVEEDIGRQDYKLYYCKRMQLFCAFPFSSSYLAACWEDDINYIPFNVTLTDEERFISTNAAKQHTSMTKFTLGYNSCLGYVVW